MVGFHRCRFIAAALIVLLGVVSGASTGIARAASVDDVTNCNTAGPGSLSSAVAGASAGDTIVFDQSCTIALPSLSGYAYLDITQDLTIDGSGHTIILDGGFNLGADAIHDVAAIAVEPQVNFTLKNVTIRHTANTQAALVNLGNASVYNSVFLENFGYDAGAVENFGSMYVSSSTIAGNLGLFAGGVAGTYTDPEVASGDSPPCLCLDAVHARLTGNGRVVRTVRAVSRGLAPRIGEAASTTVVDSTLTGNASLEEFDSSGSTQVGAAITDDGVPFAVGSSTIANNGTAAAFFAPLLAASPVSTLPLSEAAVVVQNATLEFGNSIVSGSGSAGNCIAVPADFSQDNGVIQDIGYNLEDDIPSNNQPSCGFSAAEHSIVGMNPLLQPLANNGGPTPTMALPSPTQSAQPSPALDAGTCALDAITLPAVDQRGVSRPQGPACDIGAFELVETGNITVLLLLPPPYTAYTLSHIKNNGTPWGVTSVGTPLHAFGYGSGTISADQVILATLGANTFFLTGYQPSNAVWNAMSGPVTITVTYATVESVLAQNRASIPILTFNKLTGDWALAENSIRLSSIPQSARLANVKTFACDVSSAQAAGKLSSTVAGTLESYAGEAYTALGGTFASRTLC